MAYLWMMWFLVVISNASQSCSIILYPEADSTVSGLSCVFQVGVAHSCPSAGLSNFGGAILKFPVAYSCPMINQSHPYKFYPGMLGG
jgi:hypothetical protein